MSSTDHRSRGVSPDELADRIGTATAPRVLDVRTPGEFEGTHIPGAYNVPLDVLREHRDELRRHLDDEVVLVCRSGARAAQAERALAEAGLPNLHVLTGGMLAWEAGGRPVNGGPARWDMERQVRLVAGLIVATAVAASTVVPALKWVAFAVGGGLTFAALTNTCAMAALLGRLPYNRGARCDLDTVVATLTEPRPI